MKQFQKVAAAILALALVLTSLTACGDKGLKPRSPGDVGKDAVSMVETNLSETEMRTAIDGYATALTEALAAGSATASFVDEKDGAVALVVQPSGTDQTQELMKFGSVKEAFSYFVYTGQMDSDGKLLTPPVVQTAPDADTAVSDAQDTAADEAASEAPAQSTATNEVTSEIATENVPESAPADAPVAEAVTPAADSASPAA